MFTKYSITQPLKAFAFSIASQFLKANDSLVIVGQVKALLI